jgi:deoxyribonuclease V
VRTRKDTRPLAVHAGWRTTATEAAEIVLSTSRARTPEPLRQARRRAREARSKDPSIS